jgi:ABC-type lipoprotein export system ATPase subunit
MVTHDEDVALNAEKIAYLKDGKILKMMKGKK